MKDTITLPPVLSSRPTYVRHLVLAALCAITTINYIQRNSVGGAETTIRADLHLTRNDTGDAMAAFFLMYALCQVPSGWLAQRIGGRRALTLFAAGWSIVMAFTAAASNLPALVGARGAMGMLQAGIFPCCTMILASWYPVTRRGFASAILNSFMLIGGVLASWMTGKLIGPLGWRWLFLLYAVPGLLWAAWFALWFRNRPQEHSSVNAAELAIISPESPSPTLLETAGQEAPRRPSAETFQKATLPNERTQAEIDKKREQQQQTAEVEELVGRVVKPAIPWAAIFLSSALWLICLQQFCRAGALRFFDQWLPTYLQEARGQSVRNANYWTMLPLLAGIFGGPVGGILSDFILTRTKSRRLARQGVAIGAILVGLTFYALAYRVPNLTGALALTCLGLFITSFSSPCAYALSMDMGGRNLGVIFGTMNMAGNLGAWAFVKFLPRVVDRGGWNMALLVFAGMYVVAVACWLLLNPNGIIGERDGSENKE